MTEAPDITAVALHGYSAFCAELERHGISAGEWDGLLPAEREAHVAAATAITQVTGSGPSEPDAVATVTVTTPNGPETWRADSWTPTSDGRLSVSVDESPFTGSEDLVALYAKDAWTSVADERYRVQSGPDGAASAVDLEAVLGEVEKAACEGEGSDWARVTEIRAILGRYRKAGR